jgi:hypothetical protein
MGTDLVLTRDMALVLGLVAFTMTMFMFERIRSDATALVVLIALGVLGLVPANELFLGFSGNAVISIIATMILGAGLDHTGALNRLAAWLLRRSKGVEGPPDPVDLGDRRTDVRLHAEPVGDGAVPAGRLAPVRAHRRDAVATAAAAGAAIVMGDGLTMVGNSPLLLLNDLMLSANRNLPSGVATLVPFPMFQPCRSASRCWSRACCTSASRQEMAARRRGRRGAGDAGAHRELLRQGLRHRGRRVRADRGRGEPAGRHVDR